MQQKILCSLLMLCICFKPFTLRAQVDTYPKITFLYSSIFDNSCSKAVNKSIEDSAIQELTKRVDEFSFAWNKDAKTLLTAVTKVTKIPFAFHETKAAFHLCDAFSSMSIPLLFNMRFFMRSLQGDSVGSMSQFKGLVLHETLHRYLGDIIKKLPGATTPLLEKYKAESDPVKSHLHLFALMNEVYHSLGREKDLRDLLIYEQTVSRYKVILNRAREIVNKEGNGVFLKELTAAQNRIRKTDY